MNAEKQPPTYPADAWLRAAPCGPTGNNCVELNYAHPVLVGVRDTKGERRLDFGRTGWSTFLARLVG